MTPLSIRCSTDIQVAAMLEILEHKVWAKTCMQSRRGKFRSRARPNVTGVILVSVDFPRALEA